MAFTQGNLTCWEYFDAFNSYLDHLGLGSSNDPTNKMILIGGLRSDVVDDMRRKLIGVQLSQLSYADIQKHAKQAEKRLKAAGLVNFSLEPTLLDSQLTALSIHTKTAIHWLTSIVITARSELGRSPMEAAIIARSRSA